jgi:hypothetical protein
MRRSNVREAFKEFLLFFISEIMMTRAFQTLRTKSLFRAKIKIPTQFCGTTSEFHGSGQISHCAPKAACKNIDLISIGYLRISNSY